MAIDPSWGVAPPPSIQDLIARLIGQRRTLPVMGPGGATSFDPGVGWVGGGDPGLRPLGPVPFPAPSGLRAVGDPGLRPMPTQPLPRDYGSRAQFASTPVEPWQTFGRAVGQGRVPSRPGVGWQAKNVLGVWPKNQVDWTNPKTPWPGITPPVLAQPNQPVVNPNTFGPRQPGLVGVGARPVRRRSPYFYGGGLP